MEPKDFLRAVWPDQGPYCVAYQMPSRNGTNKKFWKHVVVDSVDEALDVASRMADKYDMYFAVLGLNQREMIDQTKRDPKTQLMGKTVVRVHANMRSSKAHTIDVDVGEGKPYQSQAEAIQALREWVTTNQLPIPTIVSSGNGLHVYWLLDGEIQASDWRHYGKHMLALADQQGFHVDRTRTADPASVLRIPGTFNLKDTPLPVQILRPGGVTPVTDFHRALRDALAHSGGSVEPQIKPAAQISEWGESNLATEFQGPPPTLREVGEACAQVRDMVKSKGNLDQSAWYLAGLATLKFVENGDAVCHAWSKGHPDYSQSETEFKLQQLEGKGPARCTTIAQYMPGKGAACVGCRFANDPSVPNPIVAARKSTEAPAPVVELTVAGAPVAQTTIPNPPFPYSRLKDGGIARRGKSADGDDITEVIYPYDLYPLRRVANPETGIEQQLWCVELPVSGKKEFLVEAHALYDGRKFTETISHQGIYPSKSNVPYLQDYMVAYISELQKLVATDLQATHLGWIDDYKQFVLPDRVLQESGPAKPALLTSAAARASEYVTSAGTLERQVELMRFYNDKRYVAHQFYILCGLGSLLLYMTDQHGLIVNASGPAGASKSTALYTMAGMFGVPKHYVINGTNPGSTVHARNERVSVMANLPVGVDEITHMYNKDAQNLVMFVAQPTGRLRLRADGVERRTGSAHKSSIMLTTGNSSLHGLLSADNSAGTAGSLRVIEIEFRLAGVHEKPEADDYLRELQKNYGHIAPAFAAYVVQNREEVEARVHAVQRYLDKRFAIEAPERFWSAGFAVAVVAGEITYKLGLLGYDVENIKHWIEHAQLPQMRGVLKEEYNEPIGFLTNYLESIAGNILFVEESQFNGHAEPFVRNKPHGALLAHYDITGGQMFVLKEGFKQYCQRVGASMHKVLVELSTPRRDLRGNLAQIITERTAKKTLGARTEYAKAQSYCFVIDMTHADVAEGPHPLAKTLKAKLQVVK